jgi:hypothetical protein
MPAAGTKMRYQQYWMAHSTTPIPWLSSHSSVNLSNLSNLSRSAIERIIIKTPNVEIARRNVAAHASAILAVPTWLFTAPPMRVVVDVATATAAMCCHKTDMPENIVEMPKQAIARCDTGRLGKGLTSYSSSECQPGKADKSKIAAAARITDVSLFMFSVSGCQLSKTGINNSPGRQGTTYMKP